MQNEADHIQITDICVYGHSPNYAISSDVNLDLSNFIKAKKKTGNNISETSSEFFLAVMKAHRDERGRRIMLDD
jgi:hypothetical protein